MLLNLNYDIHFSFYIADQDTAQYNNYLCSAEGKLWKLSGTFKMYNGQFIQFACIPVEFVP